MRYLLDTHIVIWWLADDPHLTAVESNIIYDLENEVFVSAASAWEIEIKRRNGNLSMPDDWKASIEQSGFEWLNVTTYPTEEIRNLPMIHKDPFDRMLVAQSKFEDMRIITHDSKVLAYFK